MIKGKALTQKSSLKPHRFPDIPLETDSGQKQSKEKKKKECFQRLCFNSDKNHGEQVSDSLLKDTESEHKISQKAAQIEEQAYVDYLINFSINHYKHDGSLTENVEEVITSTARSIITTYFTTDNSEEHCITDLS